MSKKSMVLLRIAGSVVGLLVGGGLLGGGLVLLQAGRGFAVNWVPFSVLGGIVGAPAGAALVQKASGQRSSFWKALLGTAIGLVAGLVVSLPLLFLFIWLVGEAGELVAIVIVPVAMVAGAVIGSGWKVGQAGAANGSPSG